MGRFKGWQKRAEIFHAEKAEGDQAQKDISVIFAALNSGQKKQLVKEADVKEIFDRRGISY